MRAILFLWFLALVALYFVADATQASIDLQIENRKINIDKKINKWK